MFILLFMQITELKKPKHKNAQFIMASYNQLSITDHFNVIELLFFAYNQRLINQQILLQQQVTTIMFPNDDICNIDAAKGAAARLFRRYKNSQDKSQPIIGKSEVNRLMKATYDAINMPYDPNEEDVFSFISVFDTNNDGRIQLKDLETMAVKYLCGEDALLKLINSDDKKHKEKQGNKQEKKILEKLSLIIEQDSPILSKPSIKIETKQQKTNLLQNKKHLTIQTNTPTFYSSNVYTPSSNTSINLNSYFSPKSRISFKDSVASTNTQTMTMKTEIVSQNSGQDSIFKKGRQLFDNNMNAKNKGVGQVEAGKLMSLTYELFGKRNFSPSNQDIKIWMKLCDRNKDGIVDWQDYKYFLQRSYERERSKVKN